MSELDGFTPQSPKICIDSHLVWSYWCYDRPPRPWFGTEMQSIRTGLSLWSTRLTPLKLNEISMNLITSHRIFHSFSPCFFVASFCLKFELIYTLLKTTPALNYDVCQPVCMHVHVHVCVCVCLYTHVDLAYRRKQLPTYERVWHIIFGDQINNALDINQKYSLEIIDNRQLVVRPTGLVFLSRVSQIRLSNIKLWENFIFYSPCVYNWGCVRVCAGVCMHVVGYE